MLILLSQNIVSSKVQWRYLAFRLITFLNSNLAETRASKFIKVFCSKFTSVPSQRRFFLQMSFSFLWWIINPVYFSMSLTFQEGDRIVLWVFNVPTLSSKNTQMVVPLSCQNLNRGIANFVNNISAVNEPKVNAVKPIFSSSPQNPRYTW